uniref:(northern house mosquito) hypothetical protein n=1 Tax=Culex pipiens TaxID=7175 RepID=A0A8D8CIL3_CULPI
MGRCHFSTVQRHTHTQLTSPPRARPPCLLVDDVVPHSSNLKFNFSSMLFSFVHCYCCCHAVFMELNHSFGGFVCTAFKRSLWIHSTVALEDGDSENLFLLRERERELEREREIGRPP